MPLNPQFRNPPPGANDPKGYDDPVTVPAGDIAENPYWKRDVRRSYPKLSVVSQPDVVGLLSVGSAAAPNEEVLKIGDAGKTQLVEVKEEGERGLATYFQKNKGIGKSVLGPDGLPPLPTSRHPQGKRYTLLAEEEQTYGTKYVHGQAELLGVRTANESQVPLPHFYLSKDSLEYSACRFALYIDESIHLQNIPALHFHRKAHRKRSDATHVIARKCRGEEGALERAPASNRATRAHFHFLPPS